MATPHPQKKKDPGASITIPEQYTVGDRLDWTAPWIEVRLWTELPFWLMVENVTVPVECEGHEFKVAIHDNYFELFFGQAGDSRGSVGYCGPFKKREDLPPDVIEAMNAHPEAPYMWRKCKTYVKVESRCNEDVWNACGEADIPRKNEAKLYLSELCRAHIPVLNRLIRAYRLATYDYFPFEVSAWDVPHWSVEREGKSTSTTLVQYRDWDAKPLIYKSLNSLEKPDIYKLIEGTALLNDMSRAPTPGELDLLDALNLMERGDYSGAVRRITTAIEVVVEAVTGIAVEMAEGAQSAQRFLKNTRTRFDERVKKYQELSGRNLRQELMRNLKETRDLRHQIVHGGYRIGPSERGRAQKAVDTGRWTFNWFENDPARLGVREKRIAFRSLGRDVYAGMFRPRITREGVVLSRIGEP